MMTVYTEQAAMPRSAVHRHPLPDDRNPVREPCQRRGRYNVERLIAKHGAGMRLTDVLTTLADCQQTRSFSIYDRCKARYEGL